MRKNEIGAEIGTKPKARRIVKKKKVHAHDPEAYELFLKMIQIGVSRLDADTSLFVTSATGLFDTFLEHLPEETRHIYQCRACRDFVEKYGGLVKIQPSGALSPIMWPFEEVPEFYAEATEVCFDEVKSSVVTGPFYTKDLVWGRPVTGEWHHMAVRVDWGCKVIAKSVLSADQLIAEKHEDFRILLDALKTYRLEDIKKAVALLKSNALYRSEKVLGVAEWFAKTSREWTITRKRGVQNNGLWLAVANAPAGFCHIKSSMIGTLLDDLVGGMSASEAGRRFSKKMNPTQYQRPQAAPSEGNIRQAEKLIADMGVERALHRRFARLEEIPTIWKPEEARSEGGVFGHLKVKATRSPGVLSGETRITFIKFRDTVLPDAKKIEFATEKGSDNFVGVLTATYMDAPPILQWDTLEERNPFSWYMYVGGSSPERWELRRKAFVEVTAIAEKPSMWSGRAANQGEGVVFVLKGAVDRRVAELALFPETLKSEFHSIRSTIEAYSASRKPSGADQASACGVAMHKGSGEWNGKFRVNTGDFVRTYIIDRWD